MKKRFRLESDEGRIYADAFSIWQDLEFVADALRLAARAADRRGADHSYGDPDVRLEALWNAALVAYARCFARGRRRPLTKAVFAEKEFQDLPFPALEVHQRMKERRDKYLAHAVGRYEYVDVDVEVAVSATGDQSVIGAMTFLNRSVGIGGQDAVQFPQIVERLTRKMQRNSERLLTELDEMVRSQPIEAICSLPPSDH